jgi:hypothetical protein
MYHHPVYTRPKIHCDLIVEAFSASLDYVAGGFELSCVHLRLTDKISEALQGCIGVPAQLE